MRRSTTFLIVTVFSTAMAAITIEGLVVSAQNSNSSTTTQPNTNANARRTGTRRGTRRTGNSNSSAAESTEANQNANMAAPENANVNANRRPGRGRGRRGTRATAGTETGTEATTAAAPVRTGRCDPTQQEQTDLSGTYTGKLKHGTEAPMDATLTVTGNNFTMTSGSDTHSGRITAVTTCGYTAVTVMIGDLTPPAPGPNPPPPHPAMSLRAKKVGDSLTLTSVPGEPQQVMFTTGGSAMRPRKHRTKKPVAPPPPTKTTP